MEHTSVHWTYPDVLRESWSWWRPIQRKHLFAWPVRSQRRIMFRSFASMDWYMCRSDCVDLSYRLRSPHRLKTPDTCACSYRRKQIPMGAAHSDRV